MTRQDLRERIFDVDGEVRPGQTIVDNHLLADLFKHLDDCKSCPLVVDAIHHQRDSLVHLLDEIGETVDDSVKVS